MAKPHWFPFYVPDFLSSPTVTMMTAEEVGGYVLLLCYAWQDPNGSLPADDDSLRVLSRLKGDLLRIKSCFSEKKGRLYNKRLSQELDKVKEKSDAAKRSISIRWKNERNTNVQRTKYSSQSESQSQSESEKDIRKTSDGFDQFWDQYPRKIGKKAALKAWLSAKDKPDLTRILSALTAAKQSPDWTKENGKFIPHPATWLNQGRWDDEVQSRTQITTPAYRPTKVVL